METKVCNKCGEEKTLDSFAKTAYNVCKKCNAIKSAKHYRKNKEKYKKYAKKYNEENKEKVKKTRSEYDKKNIERRRITRQKRYAKQNETLHDSAVIRSIKRTFAKKYKMHLPSKFITQEMIEYKRVQLMLYRKLKTLQNGTS